ncbi:rhomboid family intramembrane serine protease [Marispirochaeta aestuarii]|uniref:rhomboid family intramembrane serine protease n=1 Tax=Marispirochaeta aestuarii TaxID=1963862 RepID=UPI0029C96742|nr:rhomboid family intramembrane serine protease [Marispirochaeta aestuarii]
MMRIRYNAPVTLTFALLATTVLLFDTVTRSNLTLLLFTALPRGNFDFARPLAYVRLISHIVGHLGWEHLLSNFAIILLIGPILEEKHGSLRLLWMIFFTALVTGLVNTLFFHTALLGASSIVFMMIILVSFTNVRNGDIPLTFILVVILYLVKEIILITDADDVSQTAHILGGICGSLFGFGGGRSGRTAVEPETE